MITSLTKPRLAVWLLVGLTVPWQLGGKQPVGILIDMLLVSLAAFLWLRRDKAEGQHLAGWGWLPLILMAWAAMSMVWSVNRYQTVVWLEVLGLAIAVFWLASEFGQVRQLRSDWLNGYELVATLAAVWGLVIYLTQDYDRLTSSFYLANPWAAYVLPAFLLASWRYAKTKQIFSGICAPILGAGLILSDSRSAWLMLAIVGVIAIFTRIGLARWRRLLIVAGATIVLAMAANVIRSQFFHHSVITQGSRFSEAAKGESTSGSDRLNYLKSAVTIWQNFPILGSGAGTFASIHPKYQYRVISASSHAHNFYAQTLAELGLIGAILLAVMVLGLIRKGVGCFRARRGRAIALVLAAMLLHLALDIDSLYPSILVVVGCLAGLMVSRATIRNKMPLVQWWGRKAESWALVLVLVGCLPAASAYLSAQNAVRANQAQTEGNYELAGELYLAAHSGWVYDPDVVNAEGIINYTLAGVDKNLSKAQAGYERAKKLALKSQYLDPIDAQHLFLFARASSKLRQPELAEAAYRRAIELDQYNHPEYYADLAYFYLLNNQPQKVLATADRIIAQYPERVIINRSVDTEITGYLGALHYFRALVEQEANPTKAKLDAQAALRLDSSNIAAKELLRRLADS